MSSTYAALVDAMDRLANVGFTLGPQWEAVHDLCQQHEGEAVYDWGHAICHRVEGDEWNAGYWYRRAGQPAATVTLADEWAAMRAALNRRA